MDGHPVHSSHSSAPASEARLRKLFNAYFASGRRDLVIRSYPQDDYPNVPLAEIFGSVVNNTDVFWYPTKLFGIRPAGLLTVSLMDNVLLVKYPGIKRCNFRGDQRYPCPHVFIDPSPGSRERFGHLENGSLVRTYGEAEFDRWGRLSDFVTINTDRDPEPVVEADDEIGPAARQLWMANEAAYSYPTRWRYGRTVREGQVYRVRNTRDEVLILSPPREEVHPGPRLTPEQKEECRIREFKIKIPIFIPGGQATHGRNSVVIGDEEVLMGDAPFALFLRLVLQLHKAPDGVVPMERLVSEGFIPEGGRPQAIFRLRERVGPALHGIDAKKFIEGWKPKTLRLSTLRDLVRCDKAKLLLHDNAQIRKVAAKLPGSQSASDA